MPPQDRLRRHHLSQIEQLGPNPRHPDQQSPSRRIEFSETTPGDKQQESDADQPATVDQAPSLLIPWAKPPSKRFREILLPAGAERHRVQPIKFERRAALLKSIARGRAWLDEIVSGMAGVEEIAARQKCSMRQVNMIISRAFIALAFVKAAIEG
jgi:site-specific DNA recombinase